jgi:hypothetical protein
MGESHMPGWCKGPIMQRLEPKPNCTSRTMHTVCITDGPLATYNLHAQMFGGKMDKDLQHHHGNVMTTQKWVNLMLIILDNFKGKGHCIAMDSPHMGDIIAQIGHKEWQLNMVGMSQSNKVGVDIKDVVNKMKVGTYVLKIWEHMGAQQQEFGGRGVGRQCNCEDAVELSRRNYFEGGEWVDAKGKGGERKEGKAPEGSVMSGTD